MRWVVVVLLWAHSVYAQPAPSGKPVVTAAQKREAASHRAKAKVFVAKKQPANAIVELEASVAIVADGDALFELATLYDEVVDEDNAFATYQKIVSGKHLADAETRMKAIIAARESIRDVIAFPKSGGGFDPLTSAPAPITPAQRKEAGVDAKPEPMDDKQ